MKRILFVCGVGGITSTVAETSVLEACRERGIEISTKRCCTMELNSNLDGIDLIVATTMLQGTYPVEVVNAIPLIAGFGKRQVLDTILQKIQA